MTWYGLKLYLHCCSLATTEAVYPVPVNQIKEILLAHFNFALQGKHIFHTGCRKFQECCEGDTFKALSQLVQLLSPAFEKTWIMMY